MSPPTAFDQLTLDWQSAWWRPWVHVGQSALASVHAGHRVHEALNSMLPAMTCPVQFVPQSALPEAVAYESFIFDTKTVPTRDNWHDFFNGLAWLCFPHIKARLNALQHAEIDKAGVQQLRGPMRDALTLFDENAAFLSAEVHAPVIDALRRRDWQTAFITHRGLLQEYPPVLFGHALLEKLVKPYKSITSHVFPVNCQDFNANSNVLDAVVSAQLSVQSLLPKPFVPLPVLGVPNWWPHNENTDFYTDHTVFRAPRT